MENINEIRKWNQKERRTEIAIVAGFVLLVAFFIMWGMFTISKAGQPYQEYELTVSDSYGTVFSCSDCYVESVKYNFVKDGMDILCPTHCPLTVTLNTGEVIGALSVELSYDRGSILCPTHCPLIVAESKRLWRENNK